MAAVLATAAACFAFLSLPCAAAAATPPDSAAVRGVADTVTVLPPVRVREERAAPRSSATTVRLERAGVVRFLPVSTADALLGVPGVDLVRTGPWASRVSLRGLSGDRVLMMVDGVRLNSVRGHGVQPSLVALDRLDAVELMPGANSTLYGSDALGGAINLITHRTLFTEGWNVGGTLSGHGSDPGAAWAQHARTRVTSPDFGLEVGAGLGGREALTTPEGRIPNSGDREEDFAARAAVRWKGTVLDVETAHHAARDVGLPAFNNAAGNSGVYPLQARDAQRLELTTPGSGLLASARLLGVLQTLRTDFTETTVDSVFFRGNFAGTRTEIAADRVRTRIRSAQPEVRLAVPGAVRLIAELRREDAEGPRTDELTVRDRSGRPTSSSSSTGESMPRAWREVWAVGAYGAAPPVRGAQLEGGIRFDALGSHADSVPGIFTTELDGQERRLSAEAGVTYPVGPLEAVAHLASGFRAPNLEELFYNNDIHGGLRLFGNPDLNTERSLSWECGVRSGERFGGALQRARVTAYRSEVRDLIGFRYVALVNGVPRFQYANVERARIEGMEYAVETKAGPVRVALHAAFPRGFDLATGQRLADIGTARATLDVGVPLERLLPQGGISARVRWNDAVWSKDPLLQRDAFSTVSVEASVVLAGVRGVLAVHNLLDASYREPMSFISEPGRTFALALRRDFAVALGRRVRG